MVKSISLKNVGHSEGKCYLIKFIPVKLNSLLLDLYNLKDIYDKRLWSIQQYIRNAEFQHFSNVIYFIRYLDHFLLGFISSKSFSVYFNKLVFNFVSLRFIMFVIIS